MGSPWVVTSGASGPTIKTAEERDAKPFGVPWSPPLSENNWGPRPPTQPDPLMDLVLHIRLTPQILEALDRRAAAESRTRSMMARMILIEGLGSPEARRTSSPEAKPPRSAVVGMKVSTPSAERVSYAHDAPAVPVVGPGQSGCGPVGPSPKANPVRVESGSRLADCGHPAPCRGTLYICKAARGEKT